MEVSICTPAEVAENPNHYWDLAVVIDVLRATSTAVVLGERVKNGILLVPRPEQLPLLPGPASEYVVFSELTSSGFERVDNSPSQAKLFPIAERTPVLVTTNGTLATEIAVDHAEQVYLTCFLNLRATAEAIVSSKPRNVVIIPAGKISNGTRAEEDDACASALEALLNGREFDIVGAAIAVKQSQGVMRRLLEESGLETDVDFALRYDVSSTCLRVEREGARVFRILPFAA